MDLIWINGPNSVTMKNQGLLYGPITQALPEFRARRHGREAFDCRGFHRSGRGNGVSMADGASNLRLRPRPHPAEDLPHSIPAMLDWAKAHPGRLTHPMVSNFLGFTFLKQALIELAPDPAILQQEATDANFGPATEPLWAWYDALKPNLWQGGREFPENGPALRQLFGDGEIDLMISFNPAEAVLSASSGLVPASSRVMSLDRGMLGNTSFVAVPYNAAHKEAAMAVANFLLEPEAQARRKTRRSSGSSTCSISRNCGRTIASASISQDAIRACRQRTNSASRSSSRIHRGRRA